MTLEELEAKPREWLTCADVAPVLGANADTIRQQAVEAPQFLGFPVVVVKRTRNSVRIPKTAFIKFMRGVA